MSTEVRKLDASELEQRVKSMYEKVALEPEREFHFATGRPLADNATQKYGVTSISRLARRR